MLDNWKTRTTTIKMKLLSPLVGFLLVGLWAPASEADNSLSLRNKQYLSPPIQTPSNDYYNTQQNTQQLQLQHQHNTFEEKKYANSRYKIFEVHNHFEPSAGNGKNNQKSSATQTNFLNNNNYYSPSEKSEATEGIHIEHINVSEGIPLNDPNLDASYLSLATDNEDSNQQIFVKHDNKNIQTYRHTFPEESIKKLNFNSVQPSISSVEQYQQNQQHGISKFKSPNYLPPKAQSQEYSQNSLNTQSQSYQSLQQTNKTGKEYLLPIQTNSAVGTTIDKPFNGPDYLPPQERNNNNLASYKGHNYLPPQQHSSAQSQENLELNVPFKGANYLPPQQHVSAQFQQNFVPNASFKGPDFLPPQKHESAQSRQNFVQNAPIKGSDCLPPQQHCFEQSQQNYEHNAPFKGSDYLPPRQQILSEQLSIPYNEPEYVPPQQTNFNGPDYLPPVQGSSVQQEKKPFRISTTFKGTDYLPPQIDVSGKYQQINHNQNTELQGTDSIPPHQQLQQVTFHQNSPFQGRKYLPPQQQKQIASKQNTQFKDADYLPPQQQQQQKQIKFQSSNQFKGADYLPPNQSKNNAPFKGRDYLPPQGNQVQAYQQQVESLLSGNDFQKPTNSDHTIAKLHTLPGQSPQNQESTVKSQTQVGREQGTGIVYETIKPANTVQNNGYLPSSYDSPKPANAKQAINQLHNQELANIGQPFKAFEYLPPGYDFQKPDNAEQAIINQLHCLKPSLQKTSRSAIEADVPGQAYNNYGYLSPGYDFQTPANAEQAINQFQSQQSYNKQQSHSQVTQITQSYKAQTYKATQQFKSPDYLPPTPVAQTFKGSDYLRPASGTQTLKGTSYSPYTTGSQNNKALEFLPPTTGSKNYNDSDYLPPLALGQTAVFPNNQHTLQVFKGPEYLPPVNVQQSFKPHQQAQFKAHDYLPPTKKGFESSIMYPLSSYMTNVKPYDRYANSRRPFAEYGPPSSKTDSNSTSYDLSSMYREPASRPRYYAPTMSYTNNAFHSQTYTSSKEKPYQSSPAFRQQARQTLQTFMPEDLRQEVSATVQYNAPSAVTVASAPMQTAQPTTAKVRTVQIVHPTAVKTLKVLESLDHSGVKTIKILGSSHEEPMGKHRVVKVVSGGHDQNVQTVKIFNHHRDVTANTYVGQNQNTGYLPPRHKRNPNSKP